MVVSPIDFEHHGLAVAEKEGPERGADILLFWRRKPSETLMMKYTIGKAPMSTKTMEPIVKTP